MSFDAASEVFLRTLGDADEVDAFNAELTDEEERERASLGSALSHHNCRWFRVGAHGMAEMKRRSRERRGKVRA